MTTEALIKQQWANNSVILYMKGTPLFPMCGFSSQVTHILDQLKANYAYVNILEHPEIRSTIKELARWPTFPQLYIQGELVGGCDIVTELFENGALEKKLHTANAVLDEKAEFVEA